MDGKLENVIAVSISEGARRLGVSPRTVATLIARKELASRRIGRRRVIPVRALEEFLRRDHSTQPREPASETGDARLARQTEPVSEASKK
jgi:excisionase family DNA binding protein